MDDIYRDGRKMADEATDGTFGRAAAAAESAAGSVGAAMRDTAGRVADAGEQVYARGARTGEQVARTVADQPLASLLVVGAVGFLLGMLFSRR